MSQILPPRGFKYSERTGPLADPTVSAGEYRLWKLLDVLAWDGMPVMGNTLNDLNALLAQLMGISPTQLRKLRASLVSRGLVLIATSGGMTTLEACEVDVDNYASGGDALSPATDEVGDNSHEEARTVVKNDHNWSKTSGQKRPLPQRERGANKLSSSSSYSLFNKAGVVKNDHNRQELTTSGEITPLLAEMCQRLQALGVYRKPALVIAQRALAANLTPDQLVLIAQSRIDQTSGNLALAATLLRDEPLRLPTRPISDTKRRFREELE